MDAKGKKKLFYRIALVLMILALTAAYLKVVLETLSGGSPSYSIQIQKFFTHPVYPAVIVFALTAMLGWNVVTYVMKNTGDKRIGLGKGLDLYIGVLCLIIFLGCSWFFRENRPKMVEFELKPMVHCTRMACYSLDAKPEECVPCNACWHDYWIVKPKGEFQGKSVKAKSLGRPLPVCDHIQNDCDGPCELRVMAKGYIEMDRENPDGVFKVELWKFIE